MQQSKVTGLEICVIFSLEETEGGHVQVVTTLQQEVTHLKRDVANLELKIEETEEVATI